MPLFNSYIMTDWSGANRRRGHRADAIWIAYGRVDDERPSFESPYSRTEALESITKILGETVKKRERVLVCFDFAYGYPAPFAVAVQERTGFRGPPWKAVWRYLDDCLEDDRGRKINGRPTNESNRFEVAGRINVQLRVSKALTGPFWCTPDPADYPHIPQRRPAQPFPIRSGSNRTFVRSLRLTDEYVRSSSPFRLFGTGSQVLTGIPRLYRLRFDPRFRSSSTVWPFETGWAVDEDWLKEGISIVHAEIYPSVRIPMADGIKDRGQVHAMWHWARDLDRTDLLWREFSMPSCITAGSKEDIAVRSEEGWILGSPASPAALALY